MMPEMLLAAVRRGLLTAVLMGFLRKSDTVAEVSYECGGILQDDRGTFTSSVFQSCGSSTISWIISGRQEYLTTLNISYWRSCHAYNPTLHVYEKEPSRQVSTALLWTDTFSSFDDPQPKVLKVAEKDIKIDIKIEAEGQFYCEHLLVDYRREVLHWSKNDIFNDTKLGQATEFCFNGGATRLSKDKPCTCSHGFHGTRCEKACGPNLYGENCELSCSDTERGCRGYQFCYGTSCGCASGFEGSTCDTVCTEGFYGSDCKQPCGKCSGGDSCDPFTGHCPKGCMTGWIPPTCRNTVSHLTLAPVVTVIGSTNVSGYFNMSARTESATDDDVQYYQVQIKDVHGGNWRPLMLRRLPTWTARTRSRSSTSKEVATEDPASSTSSSSDDVHPLGLVLQNFTATGLPSNSEVFLRLILLDEDLQAFVHGVPYTRVRTKPGLFTNLTATNITSRSIGVNWLAAPDFKHGDYFFVRQHCHSLLPCNKKCSQPDVIKTVASPGVRLDGLLPAAKYEISVSAGEEEQTFFVKTALEAPNTSITLIRVAARTNSSAMMEWSPTDCEPDMNGIVSHYAYCLAKSGSDKISSNSSFATPSSTCDLAANTTKTRVLLTNLQPMTDYKFSVVVFNTEGRSPERETTIPFTTHHTVPDPPRELAVYRLNRTAMWLRWLPPGRPSGALRWYTVEVALVGTDATSRRSERVPAAARCPAWPGNVCYTVGHLRPRATYRISVSATNEHGDLPGERTSVQAKTEKKQSEPPQSLEVAEISTHSALIRWKLPLVLNTDLTYFEVSVQRNNLADEDYAELEEDPDPQRFPVSSEQPQYEYLLKGLQPEAVYTVSVNCGQGGKPASIQFTTEKEDTLPPP